MVGRRCSTCQKPYYRESEEQILEDDAQIWDKSAQECSEALQIDKDTGTTYWWDAIKKEMDKVMVAFDVEEELTADDVRQGVARRDFVGYQEITCHWVFDVKMDLTRKARLVAGGDLTSPPSSLTYSSVVTRESVRIAFLIAGLNNLDVLACDIGNAYLNALCREKVCFEAGAEFGSRKG